MFNYFRKYIRVQAFKLNKLNEEENETATISNFLHLFTLHVTKFLFNMLKTKSLKENCSWRAKRRSCTSTQNKWKPFSRLTKTNPKKMLYQKREISATPIQLHLKEMYGGCYPHTLAPMPEMKVGRCSIFFFQSRGSLFFLSCSCHHAPEVLWI